MELFDSTKTRLYELLDEVRKGKIQLPDFQRDWRWDDYRIKGILASIAKSFPIGAIMLLETGNDDLKFKTRPVESVDLKENIKPEKLILDGQQRLTSLFQAIISNKVVNTRNDKGHAIKRWYYIDMKMALDENCDLEDAILSISENKLITEDFGRIATLDLSDESKEFQNMMFPICKIDEITNWRSEYGKYWNYASDKMKFWDDFEIKVINNFTHYMLPVIVLKKENTKEAVCQVFEKVNTGGISLNVFELLTATYAIDNFDLREFWKEIHSTFHGYKILQKTDNTDFLQSVTLLSTYNKKIAAEKAGVTSDKLPAVSCKRKDVLNLSLTEFVLYANKIKEGYIKAAKLLNENYIFKADDLPYTTQLIPLSAIMAVLAENADNYAIKEKLMQWYWCGVFGELYGGANETRYANDLPDVINWTLNGVLQINTVEYANFNASRLHTLRTRNSAAYKGIYALLMKDGAKDFGSGTRIDLSTYFVDAIDIHHIFPKDWCIKSNINRNDFDSIINKTPLSARTNRMIGGHAPNVYLTTIKNKLGISDEDLNSLLSTHVINPEHIRADDFTGFFEYRKEQILLRIEAAMKKAVVRNTILAIDDTEETEEEMIENDNE